MSFNDAELQELKRVALRTREHIIRMTLEGGCFIGASLSCADIMVYLYSHFLRISPETIHHPDRDFLLLSKGHDVPALYGVFAELGYIDKARLRNHLHSNDHIYWHPNRAVPGVEFHSGSLGHLLSVGMGIAIDCKMRKQKNRVVVILGDGELNEGSVWEACLVAASQGLSNLIAIVDRNWFQANIRTEELNPLEPLEQKFQAFGWEVHRCDGHDFNELDKTMNSLVMNSPKPKVVIADTQRGHGLPSIAEKADRWFCTFSADEVEELIYELHGVAQADIRSEVQIVR